MYLAMNTQWFPPSHLHHHQKQSFKTYQRLITSFHSESRSWSLSSAMCCTIRIHVMPLHFTNFPGRGTKCSVPAKCLFWRDRCQQGWLKIASGQPLECEVYLWSHCWPTFPDSRRLQYRRTAIWKAWCHQEKSFWIILIYLDQYPQRDCIRLQRPLKLFYCLWSCQTMQ